MSSFFSPYRHQFVRVGACVPQVAIGEPVRNADHVLALLAAGNAARVALMVFPELCLSAYAIDDLLFQDALLDAVERQVERLVAASRDLFPVFVVGAPLRCRGQLYNCGAGDPPRPAARGRAENLPAELSRILRAAAFHLGRRHRRAVDHGRRARGAVRHRSAVRRRGQGGFHLPCRDLRGSCGCRSRRAPRAAIGRRRDPAQPVGQQHHDRQSADAPPAVRLAIGALHRRLCLFRGRRRRVDDRPRLGRPGRDLRAAATRSPRPSGSPRSPKWRSPMSISAASARSGCAPTPSATARVRPRRRAAVPHGRVRFRRAAGKLGVAPRGRALSVMCRPTRRCCATIATRPTTSRSRAWRSGCGRPGSRSW